MKKTIKNIKKELENEEFYKLMQDYRHASITDFNEIQKAFENVKKYIIRLLKNK